MNLPWSFYGIGPVVFLARPISYINGEFFSLERPPWWAFEEVGDVEDDVVYEREICV